MNSLPLELILQLAIRSSNLNVLIAYDGGRLGPALREFYRRDPRATIEFLIQHDRADLLRGLGVSIWSRQWHQAVIYWSINVLRTYPRSVPATALADQFISLGVNRNLDPSRVNRTIDFLLRRGALPMPSAIEGAAAQGNLNAVQRLVGAGGFPTTGALANAIRHHHDAVAQYLIRQGVPISSGIASVAAGHGDEGMVKYLIRVGAPFNEAALRRAAAAGRGRLVEQLQRIVRRVERFDRLLESAARGGLVDLIEEILSDHDSGGRHAIEHALVAAAQSDQLAVVRQLVEALSPHSGTELQRALTAAIDHGHSAIIEYLVSYVLERSPVNFDVNGPLVATIERGNYRLTAELQERFRVQTLHLGRPLRLERPTLLFVRYLHLQLGVQFDTDFLDAMARGGHYDIVRYLHEELEVPLGEHTLDLALVDGGDRTLVGYLLDRGATYTTQAIDRAASLGRLDLVAELLDAGIPIGPEAANLAAASGNLALLELLIDRGATYGPRAMSMALTHNQVAIAEYLAALGVQPEDNLIEDVVDDAPGDLTDALDFLRGAGQAPDISHDVQGAILGDRIQILEWLRVNGYGEQFDAKTMSDAIMGENLEIVIYLASLAVPLPPDALKTAIYVGNLDLVRYLLQHASVDDVAIVAAAKMGDQAIADLLRRHGADFHAALLRAVQEERRGDVADLLKIGVPADDQVIQAALDRQSTGLLYDLNQYGTDFTPTMIRLAAQDRVEDLRLLLWLELKITLPVVQAAVKHKSRLVLREFQERAPELLTTALTSAIQSERVEDARLLLRLGVPVSEEGRRAAQAVRDPQLRIELIRRGVIEREKGTGCCRD